MMEFGEKKLSLVETLFEWQVLHDGDANDCSSTKCDFSDDKKVY